MFLYDNFNIFLKLFYWTALAPLHSVDGKSRWYCSIFVTLVLSFINIGLLAVTFRYRFFESYGNIATIVNYVYIGSLSLSNISANVQCYVYKLTYGKIIHRIQKIENRFSCKFTEKMLFQSLAFRYRLKVYLISFLLFVSFVLLSYESLLLHDSRRYIIVFLTIVSQCISALILFHIMLYVCIVQTILYELNQRIRNAPICFYSSSKIEFLKTIKNMHMDVWKLMTDINYFFSWNLPLLIIHLAIQTTYYFYWIFLILQVEWNLFYIVELSSTLLYCLVKLSTFVNCCQSLSIETIHLLKNIERYTFRTNDDIDLYLLKTEILQQVKYFPIVVTADGYFSINRSFMAGVAANCCTYLIIFIQFFLQSD